MAHPTPPSGKQRAIVGDTNALASATNIDRRTCHRVVPMKVLALGPSRSGTSSIRQALIDLGYEDCYHYASLMNENPRDADMWIEALEAKYEGKGKPFERKDWDQLLGHCMAVTDTPCVPFYRELLDAYPKAKVILSVRDSAEQWHESITNTIMPFLDHLYGPQRSVWTRIYQSFLPRTSFDRMNELLYEHYVFKNMKENGKQFYEAYNTEIQRIVPRENLLVFNVKEGWEPLCRFLGKEVPQYDFPRVNDTNEFSRNIAKVGKMFDKIVAVNFAKRFGGVVVALLCIYMAALLR